MKTKQLGFSIYCEHYHLNRLLRECILPEAEVLKSSNEIDGFYFFRSQDQGTNISVFFSKQKGFTKGFADIIQNRVTDRLSKIEFAIDSTQSDTVEPSVFMNYPSKSCVQLSQEKISSYLYYKYIGSEISWAISSFSGSLLDQFDSWDDSDKVVFLIDQFRSLSQLILDDQYFGFFNEYLDLIESRVPYSSLQVFKKLKLASSRIFNENEEIFRDRVTSQIDSTSPLIKIIESTLTKKEFSADSIFCEFIFDTIINQLGVSIYNQCLVIHALDCLLNVKQRTINT